MTKIKNNAIKVFLLGVLLIFILYPKIIIDSVYKSTLLFFNNVFVYLFPFLILSKLFLFFNVLNIFKIKSNKFTVIVLSMITGSPSNAVYIKDLYDKNMINKEELENLLIYTTNPSITFVTSFIGILLLKNINYSYIVLFSIYMSNFIIYLFLNKNNQTIYKNNIVNKNAFFIELKNSITSSIETLLIILGNIVIFNIILDILKILINNQIILTFLSCILELTSGITRLSELNINLDLKLAFITFFCLFSSVSIHMQLKSILNNFSYKRYLKYRLIVCSIGFIICYLTVKITI